MFKLQDTIISKGQLKVMIAHAVATAINLAADTTGGDVNSQMYRRGVWDSCSHFIADTYSQGTGEIMLPGDAVKMCDAYARLVGDPDYTEEHGKGNYELIDQIAEEFVDTIAKAFEEITGLPWK